MIRPADIGLPSKFREFRSYPGFSQWQTASQLATSEKRITGLCAPPGSGKSVTLMSASRLMDSEPRTLYLTINKPLQTQLMGDFANSDIALFNLVGHSAYPCTQNSQFYDDSGDLAEIECQEARGSCPYWQDVETALTRSHICSNVANWVSIARAGDPDRFGKFDLLILDEAHNLESILCGLLTVKFTHRSVFDLIGRNLPLKGSGLSVWIDWAQNCLSLAETAYERSQRDDKVYGGRDSKRIKQLRRFIKNLSTVAEIENEWVVEETDTGAALTPVFAADYADEFLFRGIKRVILSSATLTVQDLEYLGIGQQREDDHETYKPLDIAPSIRCSSGDTNWDFIEVESGFDPARRPFYYWPTCAIDYNLEEGQFRQVMNRVDRYIDGNSALGYKGVIHSISYRYADEIARLSRHKILTHTSKTSRRVIEDWLRSQGSSCIASPIMAEGIDLAYDRARYQILWKVPTPDSRNPLIAARKKRNRKYTLYLAGKTIQQIVGRVDRAFDDFGATLILDKHWGNWMIKAIEWPKYFKRAWVTVDRCPEPLKFKS